MTFMDGSFLAHRVLTISFICFSFIVKFEGCHVVELLGFESSDPNYSVQPDGSVYVEQDVANLSEPVQFMVTARGRSLETHIWETTVKLALAGHPSQVRLCSKWPKVQMPRPGHAQVGQCPKVPV